ncbi:hypothetical protein [Actinacidiphila reveromycinica]|nr:hypothetical protein [Streptomyces sp. SN-593]
MSGRALRVGWAVGGALVVLSGCSFGTHSHVTATAPPSVTSAPPPVGSIEHPRPVECSDGLVERDGSPPPPRRTTNPAGSPAATPTSHALAPTGPARTPTVRATPPATPTDPTTAPATPTPTTAPAHPTATGSASATSGGSDISVGPLTWQGLGSLAGGEQLDHGRQNSGGWNYRIDALVRPGSTVTVTVGAAQRARAGLEFGGAYGSAPAPAVIFHPCPGDPTSFRGSFFVAGDGRACVPLDVAVSDAPARHVVISFFSGRCPA